ncbi:MAG: glycosyltransferase family 9 protein [Verrucomicrobia bacterium]|nr:glycosyltransferase family 9 protein [Verrucomicrobiota bacterium]MDA1085699.1 glycosyltransferase family 9 protein [Verrucomicrobiota bacterium]
MTTDRFGKILVIAGSGIGNILLATPLVRSLRRAYPTAGIDVLVPPGRGGILEGNPDVNRVVEVVRKQGMRASSRFFRHMWRHYDLALSAQAGDRSIINAWSAGRRRSSQVRSRTRPGAWQRLLLDRWVVADDETHAVIHGLRLLDGTDVPRCYDLVPPVCSDAERRALEEVLPFARDDDAYAVLHFYPRNPYKAWTPEGWRVVIDHIDALGLRVVVTGGGGQEELDHVRSVLTDDIKEKVVDLAGGIGLMQVSDLLRGAALFVGPDTGVTHLASAHGIPTVALFGPTEPIYWGPWPAGYAADQSPFLRRGSQRVNNVCVVQRSAACIGCGKEGCDDNPRHLTRCMQELPEEDVTRAIDEMMKDAAGFTSEIGGNSG